MVFYNLCKWYVRAASGRPSSAAGQAKLGLYGGLLPRLPRVALGPDATLDARTVICIFDFMGWHVARIDNPRR
jgi:hypothetical protein